MAEEREMQEHADRVSAKIKDFYDALPSEEQRIFGAIIAQAVPEVTGFSSC
jgi:hypothetical protein